MPTGLVTISHLLSHFISRALRGYYLVNALHMILLDLLMLQNGPRETLFGNKIERLKYQLKF